MKSLIVRHESRPDEESVLCVILSIPPFVMKRKHDDDEDVETTVEEDMVEGLSYLYLN